MFDTLFTESIKSILTSYLKKFKKDIMIVSKWSVSLLNDDILLLHLLTEEIIFCYVRA